MRLIDLFEDTPTDFDEEIKGWKNAGSDLAKARTLKAQRAKNVKLVRLKNDGNESKMHDSTSWYDSEDEAKAAHDNLVKLNPNRVIRHHMHVNGEGGSRIQKLDGLAHDVEEVYPGQSSGRLKNYVKKKFGGDLTCGKARKVKSKADAPHAIKNRASWYQSLHCK